MPTLLKADSSIVVQKQRKAEPMINGKLMAYNGIEMA